MYSGLKSEKDIFRISHAQKIINHNFSGMDFVSSWYSKMGSRVTNPADGEGCSSLVFVERCVGRGLWDKLMSRPEESYRVCVSLCVI